MRIVLASQSPRRRELLKNLGITNFDVFPAKGEEKPAFDLTPEEKVCAIALGKAREVSKLKNDDDVIIAADTLVFLDDKPLGKPLDRVDAERMLKGLSGRQHTVMTGIAVIYKGQEVCECEKTRVFFREITDDEIAWYIDSGEPMDKAGAYGIQGLGSIFIPRIEGDYFNVMGLPVSRLYSILKKMDIFNLWR